MTKQHCSTVSATLSHRESEVLALVATGKSNKAIAVVLEISENTVETHMRKIFYKLKVRTRVEAALRAPGLQQWPR